jgi:hypothetical protein
MQNMTVCQPPGGCGCLLNMPIFQHLSFDTLATQQVSSCAYVGLSAGLY